MSRKASQLTGQQFGKLKVVSRVNSPNITDEHTYWSCRCECGVTTVASSANLKRKTRGIKSCRPCSMVVKTQPWSQVLSVYQRNAKHNDREFGIPENTFIGLITSPCDYCGQPPSQKLWQGVADKERQVFRWNGLDRIDSTKGYTEENVVPCCKTCNELKSDKTREEFLSAIEAIHRWQHAIRS